MMQITHKTRHQSLPKVAVLTAEGEAILPGLGGLTGRAEVVHVTTRAQLEKWLPRVDVLVVTDFRTQLLQECWPASHQIVWVHATSAGVDALLFPELVESDVLLTNARGVFDRGIAEYVLGAILMFAKDSFGNLRYQQTQEWRHRETELIDKKFVLVVGAGSIGRRVATLLKATGMTVWGVARSTRTDMAFDEVHGSKALPNLLPRADFVVITAPLNASTHGLFDRNLFCLMKPSARLINVGRGAIVVTEDLLSALQNNVIAGAALDVVEPEPLPSDSPLWNMPNVMISAHMAGDFIGWEVCLGEQFVSSFERWLRGDVVPNRVDKRALFADVSRQP
ncbi:D-2-hydroxyacid dehydrogenase [Oleiphilus messinensis]|nr:D-2-hydroxyacid dehydrogenase [Oleiphilus messinensis]